MDFKPRALAILTSVVVMLVLLAYSVNITAGSHGLYTKLGSPEGVDAEAVTQELMRFIGGKGEVPALFNEAERSHLEDVKTVFQLGNTILFLSILYLAILAFASLRSYAAASSLVRGARWGAWAAIAVVLLAAMVPWDTFFTAFHKLFFPQGNWQFPLDSMLIQLYPEQFWMYAGLNVGLLVAVFAILLLAGCRMLETRQT
ncbi:DUF1461 domain-containing protein [Candidatus Woesearchaeota archaeon]|nr:DUF1461 domain-containing protein [Candidatus Woesearchaeota archaeon]